MDGNGGWDSHDIRILKHTIYLLIMIEIAPLCITGTFLFKLLNKKLFIQVARQIKLPHTRATKFKSRIF